MFNGYGVSVTPEKQVTFYSIKIWVTYNFSHFNYKKVNQKFTW